MEDEEQRWEGSAEKMERQRMPLIVRQNGMKEKGVCRRSENEDHDAFGKRWKNLGDSIVWMMAGTYGAIYREGEGARDDEAFWATLSEQIEARRRWIDEKDEEAAQAYDWWAAHEEKGGDGDEVTRTKARMKRKAIIRMRGVA